MLIKPGSGAYDRRLDGLPPIELQNMYVEEVSTDTGTDWVLLSFPGYSEFQSGNGCIRGSHLLTEDIANISRIEVLALVDDSILGIGSLGTSSTVLHTNISNRVTGFENIKARPFFASIRGSHSVVVDGMAWINGIPVVFPDPDPANPIRVSSVSAIDGRYLYTEESSDRFWWTDIFPDPAVPVVINPLAFATAETFEDDLVRVFVHNRNIWLFGTNSVEVWRPVGDLDNPFVRATGYAFDRGTVSPHAVAADGSSVFMLGHDRVVYQLNTSGMSRVSNHGVEEALEGYGRSAIRSLFGYIFQHEGSIFYILTIEEIVDPFDPVLNPNGPTVVIPGVTYCLNLNTGTWSTLKNEGMGNFEVINSHQVFNETVVVSEDGFSFVGREHQRFNGDIAADTGRIEKVFTANIPTARTLPIQRIAFTLAALSGSEEQNDEGADIDISTTFSDDQGRTYSAPEVITLHPQEQYGQRQVLFRQGQARAPGRIYRIETDEPIRLMVGAVSVNDADYR